MTGYTYKVIEENEDPSLSVIEKGNLTATFTLAEVEADILSNKKMVKELNGKLLISDATAKNIEANHPWVKDLTPEECFTVHMYEEAQAVIRAFPPKIKEFEEGIAELEQSKEEIAKQIGVAIPKKSLEEPPKDSKITEL